MSNNTQRKVIITGSIEPAEKRGKIIMRATVMFGAGDVRIESVPDARLLSDGRSRQRYQRQ
jgi:hypothetical protein